MDKRRSATKYINLEIYARVLAGFVLISTAQVSWGFTNPDDVSAINTLYVALGSPVLPGWIPNGGDPCTEAWQGVLCNNTAIEKITLTGANLGGELGANLGLFASIITIDLSSNRIGGTIPSNLPVTLQNFFLSANQFTGSIPSTLASLAQLQAMSLNENLLTGEIPDSFQTLTGLINLDLSGNKLSGQLPSSIQSVSSLTTLHLQNNQLSGTLDVLQDLPLRDLNIENNLFSGPIPEQLLSIPTFKKDGNLFNSSIAPLAPTPMSSLSPPAPPFFGWGPSEKTPPPPTTNQVDGPSTPKELKSRSKFLTTKKVVWISVAGVIFLVILALACVLCLPRFTKRSGEAERTSTRYGIGAYNGIRDNGSMVQPQNQLEEVPKAAVARPKEDYHDETKRIGAVPKPQNDQEKNVQRMAAIAKQDSFDIDMSGYDMMLMPPPPPPPPSVPPPPPPPPPLVEKVTVRPKEVTTAKPSIKPLLPSTSARSFTIASLQQYTNSFSQDNLLGSGMLGNVYRAQLPDGKLLVVKKLDKRAADQQKDDEFIELVNNIDTIRHANVVELMGYCAEHGQRLLIYEYCSNGSLQEALHSDDELKKLLSWNVRMRMALGTARALEYLHEVCHPPVIHRNFKAANVLLDDDLAVHVSDCGLAPLISSGSVSQLSGHLLSAYGYGAPEFESGIYTSQSDVYSFGVVMLELLTGRKSHDRTRDRGEQFLVRWAIPQLHDIDALSGMVDPYLNGQYPPKSLSHFADIISRCVQVEPEFRPLMSEVVQDLQDMIRREPPANANRSSEG